MPNPTQTFSGSVDGVWFLPMRDGAVITAAQAWVGSDTPPGESERSLQVFTIPSRREKISHAGVLHLREGTVAGRLMERHSLGADEWLARLESLILEQHKYDVWMVTPRVSFKVELGSLSRQSLIMSGGAWAVQFPYRELA